MCGRLVDHHLFYKQSFIGTQPCLFTFIHGCIHVTRAKMNICNKTCSVRSVTQSCPTLCDAMDCSMPGFPVHHHLPELAHTHVYQVGDAMQPSHPLLLPSPPAFNLSQHQGLFKWVSCLHQVAKNYWSFSFSIRPSNEYRRYYARWNKPDTERQIVYDLTYTWNLKKIKFIYSENRLVVSRTRKE